MSTINKVILTGYLGRDLKVTNFANGQKIAQVPLATYDFWEDEEGVRHAVTDWHNLIFKNDKADVALEKLKKGSFLYVDGKNKLRTHVDKEGVTKFIPEIIVHSFSVMESPINERPEDPEGENLTDKAIFVDEGYPADQ